MHTQQFYCASLAAGFLAALLAFAAPARAADDLLNGAPPPPCRAQAAYAPGVDADGKPVSPADGGQAKTPVPDAVAVPLNRPHGRSGDGPYVSLDGAKLDPRLAGVTFSELPQNMRGQGVAGVGISAVRPNSRAAQAGLETSDIVIGIGNLRVPDLRTLQRLAGVNPRQLVLVVSGDDGVRYVEIR